MSQNCINCSIEKCEYFGVNRVNGCRWYKDKNKPKCPYCGETIEEYVAIEREQTEVFCDNCGKSFLLGVTFVFNYDY